MKRDLAVARLASLAQPTRLRIFRMLVQAGPGGMNAGAIALALGLAAPTLSFHVAHLTRSGLVRLRNEGRFVYYSANFPAMDDLIAYLTDDCCGGMACLPKAAAAAAAAGRRRRTA